MNGIILIDKPKSFTSFAVVNFLKKRFSLKKVGHAGTLDPLATGLLVVLVGQATKRASSFLKDCKTYFVDMVLGVETDTFDVSGRIIKINRSLPPAVKIKRTIKNYQGEINQRPPIFSALKVGGQRLYKLARLGKKIIPKKRKIYISYIKNIKLSPPQVFFEVECSKGTYIRSLCNDIGRALGCGAVLKDLRRTKSGKFSLKDAHTLDELKSLKKKGSLKNLLVE